MRNIHAKYVTETYDDQGRLTFFKVNAPEDYNFAYDVVDDIAAHEPERPAMIWCNPEGEEHRFTFADFKLMSDKAANFFAEQGIGHGDRVIVILRRHYSFWVTCLALHKIGAIAVPATFMLKEHDLEYRIKASGAKALVVTSVGDIAGVVDSVVAHSDEPGREYLKDLKLFIVNAAQFDIPGGAGTVADPDLTGEKLSGPEGVFAASCERPGWLDFNSGVRAASSDWERRPTKVTDGLLLYFTSGTSGEPKMVIHDHSYSLGHITTAKFWHGVDPEGVHMSVADSGWGKTAWGKFYGQWLMEACHLVYDFDRFQPAELLGLIAKHRLTTFCCPPTMYRMMSLEDVDAYDLSSVKRWTTAGEALNPDLFDFWKAHTGREIYEGFGQTETVVTIANMVGSLPKAGSMGKPVPFAPLEIHRDDGSRCNPGEAGEICIQCEPRPAGIMKEYFLNPEKTADVFRDGWYHTGDVAWMDEDGYLWYVGRNDDVIKSSGYRIGPFEIESVLLQHDGWYHTGDVAWMDEDGYLWYVGRNDDVIKSSGYRIGPFEIESVLLQHEAVRECAVTGVPDPLRGKAVKATIVLMPGFTGSDALTKELQAWVKTQTAPYKYPRIVEYVDELPKTFSGKIRRVEIRQNDAERGVENVGA